MQDAADGSERRIERILWRVRAEAGVRDVLAFGLGRIWLVLLELFALAYKALNRSPSGRGISRNPVRRSTNRT